MTNFKAINFGYASAETERSEAPDLLTTGYIENGAITSATREGPSFLVLGYKGAGKSAVAERSKLLSAGRYDEFTSVIGLGDFPFTPFSKIVRGDSEPETKLPIAWSWILLIYLVESLSKDNGFKHADINAFQNTLKAFQRMGLCPVSDPSKLVSTTSKKTFKLIDPFFQSGASLELDTPTTRPSSELPDFVASLKTMLSGARSDSRHYLIIDGLDDVLTTREIQWKSLGALVLETYHLNNFFKQNRVPAKIILLCRTDLFELLPGANKNKIRQDHAVELNWYADPANPDESLLIQAAHLRTRLALGQPIDIFKKYFPTRFEESDTRTYLLDMTRHTPRDFLQLLRMIQKYSTEHGATTDQIKAGIRAYSIDYFLPEIKDELSGYLDKENLESFFNMFGMIRRRDTTVAEMLQLNADSGSAMDEGELVKALGVLFHCSAIGNIQNRGGQTFYRFKYRNRQNTFNRHEGIMLHRGLWKALNVGGGHRGS